MKISEHANYLLNEFGRLQFDYAAYCKPNGESLRNEARNNLETYIAELEAERRWIPVSERLPEDGREVLVYEKGFIFLICRQNGKWVNDDSGAYWLDLDNPTYWMPLPELPEVK